MNTRHLSAPNRSLFALGFGSGLWLDRLGLRLPYTLSRNVDEIGLMVDEPKEFLAQLERRIASSRN